MTHYRITFNCRFIWIWSYFQAMHEPIPIFLGIDRRNIWGVAGPFPLFWSRSINGQSKVVQNDEDIFLTPCPPTPHVCGVDSLPKLGGFANRRPQYSNSAYPNQAEYSFCLAHLLTPLPFWYIPPSPRTSLSRGGWGMRLNMFPSEITSENSEDQSYRIQRNNFQDSSLHENWARPLSTVLIHHIQGNVDASYHFISLTIQRCPWSFLDSTHNKRSGPASLALAIYCFSYCL